MYTLTTTLILDDKENEYLLACARIRGVSRKYLVEKIMSVVCRDQLVLAVLNDDSQAISRKEWHDHNAKVREVRAIVRMESCSDRALPTHSHLTCPRCTPGNNT